MTAKERARRYADAAIDRITDRVIDRLAVRYGDDLIGAMRDIVSSPEVMAVLPPVEGAILRGFLSLGSSALPANVRRIK